MQMMNKVNLKAGAVARPAQAARPVVKAQAVTPKSVAQFAGVAVSSLALTLSAHADVTVKAGADSGECARALCFGGAGAMVT
jgi:hypothetical protein